MGVALMVIFNATAISFGGVIGVIGGIISIVQLMKKLLGKEHTH